MMICGRISGFRPDGYRDIGYDSNFIVFSHLYLLNKIAIGPYLSIIEDAIQIHKAFLLSRTDSFASITATYVLKY